MEGQGWRGWGWRRSRRSREAPRVSLPTRSRARPLGLGTCSGLRKDSAFPPSRREVAGGAASSRDQTIAVLLFSSDTRLEKPGISPLTGLIFLTIIISPLSVFFTENFLCEPRQRAHLTDLFKPSSLGCELARSREGRPGPAVGSLSSGPACPALCVCECEPEPAGRWMLLSPPSPPLPFSSLLSYCNSFLFDEAQ